MTKEEFVSLQLQHRQSGKSLKAFLKDACISYSTYNYWHRRVRCDEAPQELAPIMFSDSMAGSRVSGSFAGGMPSGATLLFPNGLRAHFGTGTEAVLMEVLKQSLPDHVLP